MTNDAQNRQTDGLDLTQHIQVFETTRIQTKIERNQQQVLKSGKKLHEKERCEMAIGRTTQPSCECRRTSDTNVQKSLHSGTSMCRPTFSTATMVLSIGTSRNDAKYAENIEKKNKHIDI